MSETDELMIDQCLSCGCNGVVFGLEIEEDTPTLFAGTPALPYLYPDADENGVFCARCLPVPQPARDRPAGDLPTPPWRKPRP